MSNINKLKMSLIIICIFLITFLLGFIIVKNADNQLPDIEYTQDVNTYKTHTSYDGIFQVKVPKTWIEVEEKYTLNKNAVLELHDVQKNAYLVAVITNKLDVTDSFEQFKKDVFTQKEAHYELKIEQYNDVVIDGYDSQYIEFYNTNADNINTYIRAYAIETKNYYVQIMLWTLKSNEINIEEQFNNIIDSFKEI